MVAQTLSVDASAIKSEITTFERANLPKVERIVKNVTKNDSVVKKRKKIY